MATSGEMNPAPRAGMVRVELGPTGAKGRVFLGGTEVSHLIRGVDVHANVHEMTTIILDIGRGISTTTAEGRGEVSEETAKLLTALGWTPPGAEPVEPARPVDVMAAPIETLCQKCDVYVGYGALGVVSMPKDRDRRWLVSHCWMCKRSAVEVAADPTGRGERLKASAYVDEHLLGVEHVACGDEGCPCPIENSILVDEASMLALVDLHAMVLAHRAEWMAGQ